MGKNNNNKHSLEKHVYIAISRLSTCLAIWQWGFKIVDAEPTYTIYQYHLFYTKHRAQTLVKIDNINIISEASFLVSSIARILYIYIYIYLFQAVCRAVNVLNVSTCI